MTMTDPIADMLTRIRNANTVGHATVDIPASKMKKSIADILKSEGYIRGYDILDDGVQGTMRVQMKYGAGKERVITGIKKISKPGLKVYAKSSDVPKVLGGLGIAIISTSSGVISDQEARKLGHLNLWLVGKNITRHGHPFLNGKQRIFRGVVGNGHNNLVKDIAAPPDNTHMPVGQGIEGSGVNGTSNFFLVHSTTLVCP